MAYQARKHGFKHGDKVSGYARQMNLFPFEMGETVADYTNATILMLANILNDKRTNKLKNTLTLYNRSASDSAIGQLDLFTGSVRTKEEIIKDILKLLDNGTKEEQESAINDAVERRKADSNEQDGAVRKSVEKNDKTSNPLGRTRNRNLSKWFGPIYTQFEGKANEAESHLRATAEGVAKGALVYPGVSPIDLVWGDMKAGYMKIVIKHPEVVGRLQEILSATTITSQSDNRIVFESDTHKMIVSRMKGSQPTDNWLLTAYEKKEKPVSASSSDIETEPEGKRNGTATPQNGASSAGKVTNTPDNNQGETEKKDETKSGVKESRVVGGNSGYVGYSMSKRAAEAREQGRFPKTDFKKIYGLSDRAFDMLVRAGIIDDSEWHHTSKFGNKTTFYSWAEDIYAEIYAANKKELDAIAKKYNLENQFEEPSLSSLHKEYLAEYRKLDNDRWKERNALREEYNGVEDGPRREEYLEKDRQITEKYDSMEKELQKKYPEYAAYKENEDNWRNRGDEISRDRKKMIEEVRSLMNEKERDMNLRDAVIELLQQSGIEVVTNEEEAQRVLDDVNGEENLQAKKRALETASLDGESRSLTVVTSAEGAKILKSIDKEIQVLENSATQPKTFIGNVAKALGAKRHNSKSEYATFETKNGKIVTIRLADHNATVSNFDNRGELNGISIVISPKENEGINNDGNAHVVEYYYDAIKLRRANGKPLADIVRSIQQALYSGEFNDTTGLAERQEVNKDDVREHRLNLFYNPRFAISPVRGKWTKSKIIKRLKEIVGTKKGYSFAARRIAEFDSAEELAEHMFYHGTQFGSGRLKPSILMSNSEVERIGGGGYGKKYWGISVSRSKRIASNFSTGRSVRVYPIILVKNAKIKEMPELRDAADLEDCIEDLWEEGVDAVWIGDKNGGEQELCVINPAAIVNIDNPDIYEYYKLGTSENPLNIIDNDGINKLYQDAKRYVNALENKPKKPEKPSRFLPAKDGETIGEMKSDEQYQKEMSEYERKLDEYNNSEEVRRFQQEDEYAYRNIRFFKTPSGHAYGFTVDGKIYVDKKIAGSETPIHEYSHLWAASMRQVNQEEWKNIVNLMKGTTLWEEVKKMYPELTTDDDIADEVLAHYSGKRGAERLKKAQEEAMKQEGLFDKAAALSAIYRVKEALNRFWKGVADFIGVHFTSAEEVADKVLSDLLNGVNPANVAKNGEVKYEQNSEEADIVARAKADGTYMKAPNDKPTNLKPRQWVQVRTKAFKKWFGDWELGHKVLNIVSASKEHGFKSFDDARTWAKANIVRTLTNDETGNKGEIRISNNAVAKFLSESAVAKSESKDVHLSVLKVLPDVIRESVDAEQHPDYKKGADGKRSADNGVNENVTIHRLYGAARIDGKTYRVKVTLKEYADSNRPQKAYSYEATKIELLAGTLVGGKTSNPSTNNSISSANLLKGVEKSDGSGKKLLDCSKVVDENGEPLVVYHQTNSTEWINRHTGENFDDLNWQERDYWMNEASSEEWNNTWEERDFNIFDTKKARRSVEIPGMFFAPKYDENHEYGNRTIEAFLNIKNPITDPNYREMGFDLGTTDDMGERAMNHLIELRYDGVINTDNSRIYEYVAFAPTQIKSATDNIGTFDPNNPDIRYQLSTSENDLETVNERFNNELERLTEENKDSVILSLGRPSAKLRSAGVEDKPMKLYGNKVIKKMKNHGFSINEIKNLPSAVAEPIAVFNNIRREGNRSILTELKTKQGNFLVAIDLGKGVEDIDFNVVSSVFGKNDYKIADWIINGYATYINKEKALNFLHHSAPIAEALRETRLISATKVVKEFKNPIIEDDKNDWKDLSKQITPGDASPHNS